MKKTLLFAGSILLTSYFGIAQSHDVQPSIQVNSGSSGGGASYDLAASNLYIGTEYPLTPTTQVRPMFSTADLTNLSSTTAPHCTLAFSIVDAGLQSVYFQNVYVGYVDAGLTVPVSSPTSYTPPASVQEYEISGTTFLPGLPDPNSSNNTVAASFSVTDTVFARENGNFTGNASIGASAAGKLCNKFELVNDDLISSISAYRTTGVLADMTLAEIYDDNSGTPNALVASSAVVSGFTTDPEWYTYPLTAGPIFLSAGTYHACIDEEQSTAANVATADDDYFAGAAHVYSNSTWSLVEDQNDFYAFAIRMNTGNCEAEAGTLNADATPVCLDNGSADISASEVGAPNVPTGYQVVYVLTEGSGLVIVDFNTTSPDFTVSAAGDYTIHALVVNPATLDPLFLPPGTTAFDVDGQLLQGGGTICGALDMTGAPITVESCIVGIEEEITVANVALYPNPSNGQFVVEVNGVEGDAQITIFDVAGRKVFTEGVAMNANFRKELNLDVEEGTYLLQISTVEGKVTHKLQVN